MGWIAPMRYKLFIFVVVIIISLFIPTDEALWHALSRVACTVWVVRHLKRDYDDLAETLGDNKKP
jgi:hypothetical protein